jgi:ParB-like chromosome segregation protein Spo0J
MDFLTLAAEDFAPLPAPCREPSNQLISSIAMHGQLVPIIVHEEKGRYSITDGRRRKQAIDIINEKRREDGFDENLLPYYAVVMEEDALASGMPPDALHTLTANILRERNEVLEADAIHILTDNGHGHDEIAQQLGVSKAIVAQLDDLRRKLSPEAWAKLESGQMSVTTAKRLLRLDHEDQKTVVSRTEGRVTGKIVDEVRREKRQDLLAGLPTVAAAQPGLLLAAQLKNYIRTDTTLNPDQQQTLDRAVAVLETAR